MDRDDTPVSVPPSDDSRDDVGIDMPVDSTELKPYEHGCVGLFLLRVYGANEKKVVASERHWYYTGGALMIAISMLATLGMTSLLANRWPEQLYFCIAGGVFWGVIIVLIERSFTSYVERYPTKITKTVTPIPRLLLGVLAAVVVSESIVMFFFSNEIDQQLVRLNAQNSSIAREDMRASLSTERSAIESKKTNLESAVTEAKKEAETARDGQACEFQTLEEQTEKCRDIATSGEGGGGGTINDQMAAEVTRTEGVLKAARAELDAYVQTKVALPDSALSREQRTACRYAEGQELSRYEEELCVIDAQVNMAGTSDADTLNNVILNRMIALWLLGERFSPVPTTEATVTVVPALDSETLESSPVVPEDNSQGEGPDIVALQGTVSHFWHVLLALLLLVVDLSPILMKIFRGSTYHDEWVRADLPPIPLPLPSAPVMDIRYPIDLAKKLTTRKAARKDIGNKLWGLAEDSLDRYWRGQFEEQAKLAPPVESVPQALPDAGVARHDVSERRSDATSHSPTDSTPDVATPVPFTAPDDAPPRPSRQGAAGTRNTAKDPTGSANGNLDTTPDTSPELRAGKILRPQNGGQEFRLGRELPTDRNANFTLREVIALGEDENNRYIAKITSAGMSDDDADFALKSLMKECTVTVIGGPNNPRIINGHSNVEYDEKFGVHFWVMDRFERGDLDTWMKENPDRTLGQVLDILDGVFDGLAGAHKFGYTHCDIKPANILVRDKDDPIAVNSQLSVEPVICDWGDSKRRMRFNPAKSGTLRGSFLWTSPEQFYNQSNGDVDNRDYPSDLYSAAAMGVELITGQAPRVALAEELGLAVDSIPHARDLIEAGRTARRVGGSVPVALDEVLARWQSYDPAARQPNIVATDSDSLGATMYAALEELRTIRQGLTDRVLATPVQNLLLQTAVKNW
ncbi:DUF4407 domain-containing protein [Rhodococcus globerulus]|uniref:DUF4407 domain-containing protein n=1 Tax=Rhodococcus globerulus TaxID=33008 RepID=UPI003016739A